MSVFARFIALGLAAAWPGFAYELAEAPTDPARRPLVILDPGHGGEDPGAHHGGVVEKNLCLDVARLLKAGLERRRIPAILTRAGDVTLTLDRRVAESQQWDRAIYVSLHANQVWRQKKPHGIIVYSYGRAVVAEKKPGLKLPPLTAPPAALEEESARLAETLLRGFRRQGLKVEGVVRTDYYVLKNPKHPSVLIELGFLTNPKERQRLADPAYQNKLAEILARGIEAYVAAPPLTASARR